MSARISFFFNDTATTEIYTLSLHDALPIYGRRAAPLRLEPLLIGLSRARPFAPDRARLPLLALPHRQRSEEHTSELQSRQYLVCRLLLEKKKPPHVTAFLSVPSLPSHSFSK